MQESTAFVSAIAFLKLELPGQHCCCGWTIFSRHFKAKQDAALGRHGQDRGAGTLNLASGANSYTGATTVTSGALAAGATNRLHSRWAHTILGDDTLALNSFNQTVTALDNTGFIRFGRTPGATLTVTGTKCRNSTIR